MLTSDYEKLPVTGGLITHHFIARTAVQGWMKK